uniref:Rhophilin Rho GTPase binding protein 1 n=1 Tax=Felis catus TaxID=9685 RepID=A0ABI7VU73_FELCA
MIPEERTDDPGSGEESARLQPAGSVRKGRDPLAQTPRGRLQSRRAQVHQQINKELRMRTGAENLYRATSNAWVRETVALELSYVNSSLQLLKEELEELNGSAEVDRPKGEGVSVPMIPLGLKETKELDWSTPLRELISGHFGEDSATYEAEIRELEDLRQAIRTPSRGEAGLELLMAYYNQLCFLDARFIAPTRNLGLLFQWYDSLTGVPAQQRALAFEKGSVLFNIGALYTQIGARQDRSCPEGTRRAIEAFQRAAGAFSLLRENFSRAPSPDMSPASLSMLERLMTAQAQECIFEGLLLPSTEAPQGCLAQLRLAQEAAQVAAEYRLVHQTMAQPPVRDYVPFPWTTLVRVKAEYFRALAHYHAAAVLCDSPPAAEVDCPALSQAFLGLPATPGPPGAAPQEQEGRRMLAKTQQKPEIRAPSFSRVKVTDIFHRLGPLSVFSAKNCWRLVGPVHVTRGEAGFGLTLRGDAPVLIAAVIPGGPAAAAGLREGDYIVSLNGRPCKWWKHAEVVAQLKGVGDEGASLQVVTLLPRAEPPSTVSPGGPGRAFPRAPARPVTARASERGACARASLTGVAFWAAAVCAVVSTWRRVPALGEAAALPAVGLRVPTLLGTAGRGGAAGAVSGSPPPAWHPCGALLPCCPYRTPSLPLTHQPPPPGSHPAAWPQAGQAQGANVTHFCPDCRGSTGRPWGRF